VIDWTGAVPGAFHGSAAEDAAKKTRKAKGGWLAEFLRAQGSAGVKDLAQRTGLKIVL
jgi:hypothetical protein